MTGLPERIVYVDDEQDLREIVRMTLEDQGYEGALATCGSGKELFSRLRVLQPELIMIDLRMPDMNGPDVVEKLKLTEEAADTPIIFVTGEKKIEMLEHYKNLGVIGVIHKPIDVDTLMERIENFWAKFKNENADEPEPAES